MGKVGVNRFKVQSMFEQLAKSISLPLKDIPKDKVKNKKTATSKKKRSSK